MVNFIKKPVVIILAVIALIAVIGYFYFSSSKKATPNFVVAKIGNIVQEVNVTGRVKAIKNVDLAFEKSGKISDVYADVGNYVNSGSVLVKQDNSELNAQLLKAEADLDAQKADFDKAQTDLNNYYSVIINILNSAYTKADDAVRNQTNDLFTDGETNVPKLSFTTVNSQAQTDSQNGRLSSRSELNFWRQEIDQLSIGASNDDLYAAMIKGGNHLNIIRNFLIALNDALNKTYGLTQSTLDSYKTNINTARSEVNTASDNLLSQKNSIDSQKTIVASDNAAIQSYGASVKNIEAQIAKTILYSPISGVVTKQDAKVGEIAAAGTVLVSILSPHFQIEADVPEADIAKMKVGNDAKVTLDAYGSDVVFDARVISIDPAEKMIEGVATYKATFEFVKSDEKIKSGMTANVDVLAAKKENTLIIPQRAVIVRQDEKFAEVLLDGKIKEIKITTGLRGSDGNIEVTGRLKDGDKIILAQ